MHTYKHVYFAYIYVVCIHAYTYLCMHAFTFIYIYMYLYVYICTHVYLMYVYEYTHICIHSSWHGRCAQTYIRTLTYKHIPTRVFCICVFVRVYIYVLLHTVHLLQEELVCLFICISIHNHRNI